MNSVALPASASTQVVSAEADLVRQAARGDAEAFGELYRRHSAPAWRLAQAVTADRESATSAFRDGFVRAVRSGRFPRRAEATFRPHVLSSVYRAAVDQAYDRTAAPAPSRRSAAEGPDAALADAAFRSLPERWRAALWLGDVENLEADRVAAILGVSAPVADQLVARGRRGLAGRFAQAHREAPEHIGEVLRPLTLPMPANLQEVASARWSSSRVDHAPILAPLGGWLENRAVRPMSVAVGTLIGLGLIAMGVVPGGSTVRSQLGAANPSSVNGAVPVQTCLSLFCPAGTPGGAGGPGGSGLVSFTPSGGLGSGATYLTSGGSGGSASGGSGGGTYPGGSTPPGGGSTLPGGGTPPPGGGGTTTVTVPSPVTVPSSPVTTSPTTIGVSGVATLSTGSGGSTLNLLGGTATASTGTGGTSISLGSPTTTTVPSTTTTTTNLIQSTTNTVTGVVGSLSSGL